MNIAVDAARRDAGRQYSISSLLKQKRTMFCILAAMSSVRSAVVPPAPQVMSQKVGPNDAMRSCLSNRFSTPCEALGSSSVKSHCDITRAHKQVFNTTNATRT